MEEQPIESEYTRARKEFLLFAPLCSPEQIGVIFLLVRKHSGEALEYDEEGNVSLNLDLMSDHLLSRLNDQLDMWGIGYAPTKKK
jgi:hypothetical protein